MTTRTHSIAKKREERRAHDAYETDPLLCAGICERLGRLTPRRILEPGAGSGNFVRAMRSRWYSAEVTAVEIRPECLDALAATGVNRYWICDFLDTSVDVGVGYDLILTNPPFSLVEEFIERCVPLLSANGVLALLLKLHFFGTRKRVGLLAKFPYYAAFPIIPRPDFTEEGRDTAEYGLVTWKKKDGELMAKEWLLSSQPIVWR